VGNKPWGEEKYPADGQKIAAEERFRETAGFSSASYVIVARSSDLSEVQVIRSYLESFGIPVVVMQNAFADAVEQTVLRVPESMAEQAGELIERYKKGEYRLDEPDAGDTREHAGDLPTFRVYSRPDKAVLVVVKEGFSWPALIFGWLWFLLNGMWVNSIFLACIQIGAWLYFKYHSPSTLLDSAPFILYLAVHFLMGKLGNTLLGLDLENKGYVRLATVAAKNPAYAREAAGRLGKAKAPGANADD
jgi:hypothetical protein